MWPAVPGQLVMLAVMPSSRKVVPAVGVTGPDAGTLECPRPDCDSDAVDLGEYAECRSCGYGWSL